MNKIIAIGDVHGRDTWKEILEQEGQYDVVVFIGDYFDSWDLDAKTQMENFKEIIKLKRKRKNKVILLTGNHDLHYMVDGERYSGYQEKYASMFRTLLEDSKVYMDFVYKYEDMVFSHAGVTKTWAKDHGIDQKNLMEINKLPLSAFCFSDQGDCDNSGNDVYQSPVWVRPPSLKADMVDGYTQIVGHTQVEHVTPVDESFIMIDAPEHKEYIVITDESCVVKKVNNGKTN